VRIIVDAKNLKAAVAEGRFREDLYYRLSPVTIAVPALRERLEDVPALARVFLNEFAATTGRAATGVRSDALEILMNFDWPGNVRQLEVTLQRAAIVCDGAEISIDDLPPLEKADASESKGTSQLAGTRWALED
jgi:DNA-binding NtrC family response regulator